MSNRAVLASRVVLSDDVQAKSFDSPDRSWQFLDGSERTTVEFGAAAIGRGVYRPGWRWSRDVQPLSGTESAEHLGYVISGRMRVRGRDGGDRHPMRFFDEHRLHFTAPMVSPRISCFCAIQPASSTGRLASVAAAESLA